MPLSMRTPQTGRSKIPYRIPDVCRWSALAFRGEGAMCDLPRSVATRLRPHPGVLSR
jgi:hypothetical protein